MKKFIYSLFCATLALSCFTHVPQLKAYDSEDITPPELKNITQRIEGTTLHLDFEAKDKETQIHSIDMSWMNEKEELGQINLTVGNDLIADGNDKFHAVVDLSSHGGFVDGNYESKKIILKDNNDNNAIYLRDCDGKPENICRPTLPNGTWDDMNLTISGIGEKIEPPKLTKFSPKTSMKNLATPNNVELNFDYELEAGYELSINLKYLNKDTGKVVTSGINLFKNEDNKYVIGLLEELKYKGTSFEFLSLTLFGHKNSAFTDHVTYSFKSKEDLEKYDILTNVLRGMDTFTTQTEMDITISNYVEDNDAPKLDTISWVSKEVTLPGFVELNGKLKDGKDVDKITYELKQGNETIMDSGDKKWNEKGDFSTTMSFKRYGSTEPISLKAFILKDRSENTTVYCNAEDKDVYLNTYPDAEFEPLPNIGSVKMILLQEYDLIVSAQNADYIDKIVALPEGSTVVVDTSQTTKIKKGLFDAIKGRDITVIFEDVGSDDYNAKGIQWVFNGKDITNPAKDIDVKTDLKVKNYQINGGGFGLGGLTGTMLENNETLLALLKDQPVLSYYYEYILKFDKMKDDLYKEFRTEFAKNGYIETSFQPNGELPGKATIRIRLEYALRGEMPYAGINAYYVNGDKFDLVDSDISIEKDGSYAFNITHNSKYILTQKDLKSGSGTITPTPPNTGDTNSTGLLFSLALISIIALGYSYKKIHAN